MTIFYDARNGTLDQAKLDDYRASSSSPFDIDSLDPPSGLTALSWASKNGHVETVKLLLENGASAKQLSRSGCTPVWFAVQGAMDSSSRARIIQLLHKSGADIDKPSPGHGNYTPLMNAIVQWKDPDLVLQLIDFGADKNFQNSTGETATSLAQKTGNKSLLWALDGSILFRTSRFSFVQRLVALVLHVIAYINGGSEGSQSGILARLFGIFGRKYPENEQKIQEAKTIQEYKDNLNNFIEENGMDEFFEKDDPFLKTLVQKAAKLKTNPNATLNSDDYIRDLTKLSLFQPILYCDDSSSMKPALLEAQKGLVKRIAQVTTYIVPDDMGIDVFFINSQSSGTQLREHQVEDFMEKATPSPGTPLGSNLVSKVLEPLVFEKLYKGGLKRPVLISIITDGCPNGEPRGTFERAMLDCGKKLVNAGYERNAVRFQISQIGDDDESEEFIKALHKERLLKNVIFCTTDKLDKQYKAFKENDKKLEQWLLKTLMGPITGLGADS